MKGTAGRALAVVAVIGSALLIPGAGPAIGDGIGVYPIDIQFDESLRGGEYFRTLGIINGDESERTFSFEADGEAGPYLSFVDSEDRTKVVDSIVAPPDSEGRVLVRLLVPSDLPNGEHSGVIRVLTLGGEGDLNQGAGAAVNVGAEVSIEINVTGTQKLAGSILDVAARDIEVGYPLRLRTTIQNSGNVRVNPRINLEVVDPEGTVVGDAFFPEDPTVPGEAIFPDESKTLSSEWDSTGQELGERVARVSVKFGDFDAGTKEIPFNILALGTLTRRGELERLDLTSTPNPGELAKIIGVFRNTGQIETRGKFVGELFRGDQLIEALSSEERLVLVGEKVDLEVFATIDKNGEYTVKGKVNYEGKETDVMELTFQVGSDSGLPVWLWILLAGGVIVGAGSVYAGRSTLRRRLRPLLRRQAVVDGGPEEPEG